MKEIKGSQTENNLRSAISGETQARVLYQLYEKIAKDEGFYQIAKIFGETSHNEKAHAEIYFNLLKCIGTTQENLLQAEKAENYEHTVLYKNFAETARQEGYPEIAAIFELVGNIEAAHEKRFATLRESIETNTVYSKPAAVEWVCTNCGYRVFGENAPKICPVCKRPIAVFEVAKNNN